ncbi:MAG: alpha/beta fold hydrolase [Balneolaceae bacterium]
MQNSPHFFEHRGKRVAWQSMGSGRPLLFLHGWGSHSGVMKPLAKALSSGRTCILLDFPGFGQSEDPADAWDIGDYADLVQQFVHRECGKEPVDVVAHSFGCRVMLKLLRDGDKQRFFRRILITGGAGLKPKRSTTFYLKSWTAKLLKLPFSILPGALREKALSKLRTTRLWKSLGSSDYQKLAGVMRETFVRSVSEHFDDHLRSIPHDILLLWGENDAATPMDQARRLEQGLANSALVTIEQAGHYAFLDQPTRFAAIANAFLNAPENS